MIRKFISADGSLTRWEKDASYRAAYDALASAMITARSNADMTQEQVAKAMGTTQAVVARLESGGKGLPSTRTLERLAKAMHIRLRISFEPAPASR